MARRNHAPGLDGWESEESRADTEPLASDPVATLSAHIPWLERVALFLIRNRATADVASCERVIAAIKSLEETLEPGEAAAPLDFASTPMAADVRQLIGGVRSILRAISAGTLPLDHELRTELADLVNDIIDVVIRGPDSR